MAEAPATVHVQAADGRDLEVSVNGPPDGTAFVFHHGTPGSGVQFGAMVEAASRRGLRTITYSRPGYSRSSPQPGRSVADAAADVARILDELSADRFVTLGWSGGGPHALACAARLSGRCLGAGTIAGVAPYTTDGLDFPAGMGPENIEEFGLAADGIAQLTPYLEEQALELATVSGEDVAAALGGLVSEVDKTALTSDFAQWVAALFRTAVATGVAGWRDDDLAFTRHWGFEVGAITTPLALWQGGEDRMVPFAHGGWLAANMPAARAHLYPDAGHLSLLVGRLGDILDDLVDLAKL
jgi:pimeloyl-ACP methyl ester carboxylesterase